MYTPVWSSKNCLNFILGLKTELSEDHDAHFDHTNWIIMWGLFFVKC